MSNKIAQFFKMLSLSQLPRASSENELLSSQNSALSSAATEVEAENQNSPIVSSFLHSCTIEIDPPPNLPVYFYFGKLSPQILRQQSATALQCLFNNEKSFTYISIIILITRSFIRFA